MTFYNYDPGEFYDEMFTAVSEPRKHAQLITRFFDDLGPGELQIKQEAAEHFLLQMGITFNVYG
ncbi:MAG TPA: hypothetical protein VJ932_00975, partial [Alkalispirochaeta sp.]|nr:hypothetical protein [Alkalispirochaeta sp.]